MKSLTLLLVCCTFALGCLLKPVPPPADEVVKVTNDRTERGYYIVNTLAGCGACHTTRESGLVVDTEGGPGSEGFLAGGNVIEDSVQGTLVWVPNVTSDPETGVGKWTDGQLMRAIRDGVRIDDKFMYPIHPASSLQYMSDEDLRSVVAYLRTAPKKKQKKPRQENKAFPLTKLMVSIGWASHLPGEDTSPPDKSDPVKYGEYIAHLAGCSGCHSMGTWKPMRPSEADYMSGSKIPFADPRVGKVWAPNLTPDPKTGIGRYTDEQLREMLLTGKRPDGRPLLPPMSLVTPHLANISVEDMDALIAYLRSLKPVKNRVPLRELTPEGEKLLTKG